MFYGASGGLSAILPSIHSLLVHTVHGQEQLTRFDARLAFMEKVYFDLVELHNYVNATLTNAAEEAASALALPTNLVRQEDGVGIQASKGFCSFRCRAEVRGFQIRTVPNVGSNLETPPFPFPGPLKVRVGCGGGVSHCTPGTVQLSTVPVARRRIARVPAVYLKLAFWPF